MAEYERTADVIIVCRGRSAFLRHLGELPKPATDFLLQAGWAYTENMQMWHRRFPTPGIMYSSVGKLADFLRRLNLFVICNY